MVGSPHSHHHFSRKKQGTKKIFGCCPIPPKDEMGFDLFLLCDDNLNNDDSIHLVIIIN